MPYFVKQSITPWTLRLMGGGTNSTTNWNAQPAGDSEIFATTNHGAYSHVDLRYARQFRLSVKFGATGNAGAKLYLKASVSGGAYARLESGAGTTGDVTYSSTNLVNGSWVSIDPTYRKEGVTLSVYGSGGNASTALALRMIEVEFR
jgi:hypothetical protein